MARTASGDDAAFAILVRRYVRSATLLAAQILGDADDAEDAAQDAFTVVHREAHTFDEQRPFPPWLFSIVRRIATNRRARDTRRARLLQRWASDTDDSRRSQPADAAMLAGLDSAAALSALQHLSPMQRACFELVALRDIPIEEVAAMHGIAESTVRQHVFRARATLRGELERDP